MVTRVLIASNGEQARIRSRYSALYSARSWALNTFSLLPWLWLLLFASVAARARLHLGHWPRGMRWTEGAFLETFQHSDLDPKVFGWHALLAYGLTLTFPLQLLLSPALFARLHPDDGRRKWRTRTFVGGLAATTLLVTSDPSGLWNWFLD